jgi:hypothetical protein
MKHVASQDWLRCLLHGPHDRYQAGLGSATCLMLLSCFAFSLTLKTAYMFL